MRLSNPITTRIPGGEASTVLIEDVVETCIFWDNGESEVIGRTLVNPRSIQQGHLDAWNANRSAEGRGITR